VDGSVRDKFGLTPAEKAVVVAAIALDSAAATLMEPGELIRQVGTEGSDQPEKLLDRLARLRAEGNRYALVLVQGPDGLRWLALPVSA
jgi:serine protease Do